MVVSLIKSMGEIETSSSYLAEQILNLDKLIGSIKKVEIKSEYQVEKLIQQAKKKA
jgi:hypothetical protein